MGNQLQNPISVDSFPEFITKLLDVVVTIGVPVLVVMIIYIGFLFVFAQGNPTKIEEAKKAFLWTIVGAAIVLGAFVIAEAIQGTINSIKAN